MSSSPFRTPLWALAFAEAPVALCVSRGSRIAECNAQFLSLFGYSAGHLVGRSLECLCRSPAEFRTQRRMGLSRLQQPAQGRTALVLRHADGRDVMCSVSARLTGRAGVVVWMVEEVLRRQPERCLSPREREVADLLVQGQTAKQMARCLGLSPRTVEMHRANLMKKFATSTTPALVAVLSGGA